MFSELGTSALYLLAAPSTPPEAREEVLGLVDEGEKISYTRAKNIINRYKELPLVNDVTEEIDIEVKAQAAEQQNTDNLLFRLETSESNRIVKLYHAFELEAMNGLAVGATVKITVGRWRGQTARIIEVLDEQQLITNRNLAPAASLLEDITVSIIDEADISDRHQQNQMDRQLIISYGSICLAITANTQTLTAFTEQIKEPEFVRDIFQQALDKQIS